VAITNPWTYRASASASTTVGASGAGSYSPAEDDVMLLVVWNADTLTATWTPPAGWTLLVAESVQLGGAVYYRFATAGESGTPPVFTCSVSGELAYRVAGIRSDSGDPPNLLLSATHTGSDTNANPTETAQDNAAAGTLTGEGVRIMAQLMRKDNDSNNFGYTAVYYQTYTDGLFFTDDFVGSFATAAGAGAHVQYPMGQWDATTVFDPTLDVTFGVDGQAAGRTTYAAQAFLIVDFFTATDPPVGGTAPQEWVPHRVDIEELPYSVHTGMFD
jgi:hypothetical protein